MVIVLFIFNLHFISIYSVWEYQYEKSWVILLVHAQLALLQNKNQDLKPGKGRNKILKFMLENELSR